MTDPIQPPFAQLLDVLDLRPAGDGRYEAGSMNLGWKRIYGGQVIAQALVAATRTVPEDRAVHSLHAYFLRPGDPEVPVTFEVDRLRDGGSFTARHARASQNGRAILTLSASFKTTEAGLSHHEPMVEAPAPEDLPSIPELMAEQLSFLPEHIKQYWLKRRPLELRPIGLDHYVSREPLPPTQNIWLRAVMDGLSGHQTDEQKAEPGLAAAIIAYLSDMTLLDTSLFPHGRSIFNNDLQVASIDHAMWFHTSPTMEHLKDWLFYQQSSPASDRGTGLAMGGIYNREGRRLVSVAQEGLIRVRTS
ncbi:MAG: acyl-CoA thioesterase II [Pseudomonadota bacterium]